MIRSLALLAVLILPEVLSAQPVHVLWDHAGATDSSRYGWSILPLGDQNDDGYADWAVYGDGAHNDQWVWVHQALEFFHGGPMLPTVPYLSLHIDSTTEQELTGAGVLGDINGDGYRDWFVAALVWSGNWSERIRLYFGGPGDHSAPDVTFRIDVQHEWCYPLGDFNGDGYDDFGIYDQASDSDFVHVYYGGSPFDTLADWFAQSRWGHFGETQPCGSGDFNGDGYTDILGFHFDSHIMVIFLGGADPAPTPAFELPIPSERGVVLVRDLNGDGMDDILMDSTGSASVIWGRTLPVSTVDAQLAFPCGAFCGPNEFIPSGDFNHDGYNDLLMLGADNSLLTLHLGHPWLNPWPALAIGVGSAPLLLQWITTAVGLGDVNGDGIDDLGIGSGGSLYAVARGRAVIVGGDTGYVAGMEERVPELPQELRVSVYPNPFNSTTEIRYSLPRSSHISLKVFDITGREVATLVDRVVKAGEQRVAWQAEGLASGVYFVRLAAGEMSTTRKVLLVR